jgi:hypothetical protein
MILISPLVPPAAMAGRTGVATLYFALITALSLFLLLQMTVSRYALVSEISAVSGFLLSPTAIATCEFLVEDSGGPLTSLTSLISLTAPLYAGSGEAVGFRDLIPRRHAAVGVNGLSPAIDLP